MIITKDKNLKQLQEEFCEIFPGLKIEFYKNAELGYEGPYNMLHYDLDTTISQFNSDLTSQKMEIDEEVTVAEFEEKLSEILGINAQVFRRSKELWLQTTSTDKWTLARQNLKGLHSMQAEKV